MSATRKGSMRRTPASTPPPDQNTEPSSIPWRPLSELIYARFPGSKLPRIKPADHALLREKQKELAATALSALKSVLGGASTRNALRATLIFAQYEAVSAVCIHPEGWVLTSANGFRGTDHKQLLIGRRKWMLLYTGVPVEVECRHYDAGRDLALLKIITVEPRPGDITPIKLAYVPLSESLPKINATVYCIGQPGCDDLESSTEQKTMYNLFEVSQGRYRGLRNGANPHDNWEIGALMHDAWTYWGHWGAPLVKTDGSLCGLHSSWDDQTAMRHGIPLVAIQEFLKQQTCMTLPAAVEDGQPGSSILVPRSPIR